MYIYIHHWENTFQQLSACIKLSGAYVRKFVFYHFVLFCLSPIVVKCTESHIHSPIQIKVLFYMHKRRSPNVLMQRNNFSLFCSIFFFFFILPKITLCFNSKYMFNILILSIIFSVFLLCHCTKLVVPAALKKTNSFT